MTDELLTAIKQSVKEGINGQLVAVHQQIASNEEKRIADHFEVTEQIQKLSLKIAPFDTTRTWFTQFIKALAYLGVPAGSLYAIYKFGHLIINVFK